MSEIPAENRQKLDYTDTLENQVKTLKYQLARVGERAEKAEAEAEAGRLRERQKDDEGLMRDALEALERWCPGGTFLTGSTLLLDSERARDALRVRLGEAASDPPSPEASAGEKEKGAKK